MTTLLIVNSYQYRIFGLTLFLALQTICVAVGSLSQITTLISPTELGLSYTTSMVATAIDPYSEDKEILLNVFNSTRGQFWKASCQWNTSDTVMSWHGVWFNMSTMKVLGLDLSGCSLSGTIPVSIGKLTSLVYLNLNENALTGTIPTLNANLSFIYLQYFVMKSNLLTGSLPAWIWNSAALLVLDLSSNSLTGTLPVSIGDLTSLQQLVLNTNSITGTIPMSVCLLSSLLILDLHTSHFTGPIPILIGNLTTLQYLNMESNILFESVPPSIIELTSLRYLSLRVNSLTGKIPEAIGDLTVLDVLGFGGNSLTGSIPSSIGNLTRLTFLSLETNALSSTIPSSIGDLISVQFVAICDNYITGLIPDTIGSMLEVQYLLLMYNLLTGPIPSTIVNLVSTKLLYLHANSLSGSIPASIGNMSMLTHLYFHYNSLTGSIPQSVELLTSLQFLDLDSNFFSGSLPALHWSLFSHMTNVYMSFNHFDGQIPSSLCQLPTISELILGNNNFICFEGCLKTVTNGYYDYMLNDEFSLCGNQLEALCDLESKLHINNALQESYAIPPIMQQFPAWNTTQTITNEFIFYEPAIADFHVSFASDMSPSFGINYGLSVVIRCEICNSIACSTYIGRGSFFGATFPGTNGYLPYVSEDKYLQIQCTRSVLFAESLTNYILPVFEVTIKRRLKYSSWDCSKSVSTVVVNPCTWQGTVTVVRDNSVLYSVDFMSTILFCMSIVLCYIVLYCIVLYEYCIVLHCFVVHCISNYALCASFHIQRVWYVLLLYDCRDIMCLVFRCDWY